MKIRIVGSLAVCMIAVSALTGCIGSRGVTVPPGYDALSTCTLTELPVSGLVNEGAPGCDLEGSSITFEDEDLEGRFDIDTIRTNPDGAPALTISAVGATSANEDGQGRALLMVNWGLPGVGVALIDNGEVVEIWASTDDALNLHRQQVEAEGITLE